MSDAVVAAALDELRALCGGGFGPCGAQTLLFRPPDAPVVTGSGHAVLAAWKEALDGQTLAEGDCHEQVAVARFVLSAVHGLQREVGDGATEFVLLLHSAVKLVARDKALGLGSGAMRRQLSRALGTLKWRLQDELAEGGELGGQLRIPVDIELEQASSLGGRDEADGRLQPAGEVRGHEHGYPLSVDIHRASTKASHVACMPQFRRCLLNVLRSALGGLLGLETSDFVAKLVIQWLFRVPWVSIRPPMDSRMLFQRVQQHLKRASDAVMFMTSPSLTASCVLPPGDFILRQSVVGAQQHQSLNNSLADATDVVRFVCITCPLSLNTGANHVTVASGRSSFEDRVAVKDTARVFVSRYLRALSVTYGIHLLLSTEPIKEDVVAACTRFGISCVQFVEPDEITALGIASGTTALASLFDEIAADSHVGQCRNGVATLRLQHRPCLRLCGVAPSAAHVGRGIKQSGVYHEHTTVPQLLLHAPSKGIYKQYFAAVIKALRVLQSWLKPSERGSSTRLFVCRGAGATELTIARRLLKKLRVGTATTPGDLSLTDPKQCGDYYSRLARRIVADALVEVVVQLQQNLQQPCGGVATGTAARRQMLALLATSSSYGSTSRDEKEDATLPLFVLDQQCRMETKAGAIVCPHLMQADPATVGLVHPWARTESLLFQTVSTLEQLFRVDAVLHVKRVKTPDERAEEEEEE